jgi:hypothetical protein
VTSLCSATIKLPERGGNTRTAMSEWFRYQMVCNRISCRPKTSEASCSRPPTTISSSVTYLIDLAGLSSSYLVALLRHFVCSSSDHSPDFLSSTGLTKAEPGVFPSAR